MEAAVEKPVSGISFILATLLVGMVLSVMPGPEFLPPQLGYLRPDWVAMTIIYWVVALPHRMGATTAWMVGLAMDVILASLIGQQALSFMIVALVSQRLSRQLRMFETLQQAMIVFVILALNALIKLSVDNITGLSGWNLWYLLPPLCGALLWPWFSMALRYLGLKFL